MGDGWKKLRPTPDSEVYSTIDFFSSWYLPASLAEEADELDDEVH